MKYVLLSAAVTGISFWVTGLLMTGNLVQSEEASAAPGIHGVRVISSSNVIVNEFTTLSADVAAGTRDLTVAGSSLNSNGRFSGNLQAGELVMVAQMQGATISSSNTGLVTVGTQTSASSTGGPYLKGSNTNGRVQYLFTAVELLAAGLSAGNITSIQFNVTSLGGGNMSGWTISMASTLALTLTSTFNTGPFTTVMTPLWGGINPVNGWNAHNFTTPFNWNGISNIVVQVCYTASGTPNTAVAMANVSNKCTYYNGAGACTNATGSTVSTRPVIKFGCQVNNILWGAITAYNNAGNYEFGEVLSVPTGTSIRLRNNLKYSYTASGKVQVIRVPRYQTLTVNAGASLTTQAWNGSTGGILAAEINGTAVINGTIDVSAKGFRGGNNIEWNSTENPRGNYYLSASANPYDGGEKGESIAGSQSDYDNLGGRYGRGASANAGGGGNSHNSAGGGGANAGTGSWDGLGNLSISTAAWASAWNLESAGFSSHTSPGGGRGGYTYSQNLQNPLTLAPGNSTWGGDSRWNVGGLGGRPLTYAAGKVFMGGGGGSGNGDDNKATGGGDGGGIVYLITYSNVSGSGTINANGEDAAASTGATPKDAAGGGGGGGAVILYRYSGSLSGIAINARGGKGGDQNDTGVNTGEVEGPGGGGGGGYISYTTPSTATTNVSGGLHGTANASNVSTFPPNGATRGGAGVTATNPLNPYSGPAAPLPVTLIKFKAENTNHKIELQWSTAAENNNAYFTIERSKNGKEFSEIVRMEGSGSTSIKHDYAYTDTEPFTGTSYYRLTQTDYNGNSETFKTVAVNMDEKENADIALRVYPNPFRNSFTAEFESLVKEEVQLTIVTMNGALIYTEKIAAKEGKNTCRFASPDFKTGTYILRLSDSKTVLGSGKIICKKN